MAKAIPLSQGKVAIVDDEDFEYLNQRKWQAVSRNNGSLWYASHSFWSQSEKRTVSMQMHRYLMADAAKMDVDHINGNGLDNRKNNLRACTRSQNLMNQSKNQRKKKGTSRYKGVRKNRASGKWIAKIGKDGRTYHIASCSDEKEAALYYNVAAQLFFGTYAKLNVL